MTLALVLWLVTFVVEFVIILMLTRRPFWEVFFYTLLINTFTQPLANFSIQVLTFETQLGWLNAFLMVEFVVWLVESVLLRLLFNTDWLRAALWAFIANFVTAAMSFLPIWRWFV